MMVFFGGGGGGSTDLMLCFLDFRTKIDLYNKPFSLPRHTEIVDLMLKAGAHVQCSEKQIADYICG